MKFLQIIALCCILLGIHPHHLTPSVSLASAQDDDEEEKTQTVSFSHIFPNSPLNGTLQSSRNECIVVKANEKTTLLIGMKNHGTVAMKVMRVSGYLVAADDFTKPNQNVLVYF
jgi:hypothetical protein